MTTQREELVGVQTVDEEERPSTTVVKTVSAFTGRPHDQLPPLQTTVDVDALDRILGSSDGAGLSLEFTYCGCRVVTDGESVTVEEGPG